MNSDVLVDAAVAEALDVAMPARPLGSRGSRGDVAEDSPAELTPTAVAVLAAIPAWWASRAEAAGLSGRWADVELALEVAPPVPLPTNPPLRASWGSLTPDQVGGAYVEALSAATRARHGRHYTPHSLAAQLWSMVRTSLDLAPGVQRLPGLVRDPACGAVLGCRGGRHGRARDHSPPRRALALGSSAEHRRGPVLVPVRVRVAQRSACEEAAEGPRVGDLGVVRG